MGPITLAFDDFESLRQLIRSHSGIWLSDTRVTFLQVRLDERLRVWNISSAREYYYFLKYDPRGQEELQRLIDAVVINETWFFREIAPLEAWCEAVLPALIQRPGRLRLWSAGCSIGAEPYTLAMLLLDNYPQAAQKVEIIATDLSQKALEQARAGIFDPYILRHTDPYWKQKYFQPTSAGRSVIQPSVRRLVHFGYVNLVDPAHTGHIQNIDMILCRNVFIYLDVSNRQIALNAFHAALTPGGHLTLGHAETLAHTSTPFELMRVGKTFLYRKPLPT